MFSKDFLSELRVAIGGIAVSVSAPEGMRLREGDPYKRFFTSEPAEIRLNSYITDTMPAVEDEQKIFEANDVWDLYRRGEKFIFNFYSEEFGAIPYTVAIMSEDFKSGDIYSNRKAVKMYSSNPLAYPLDELLMINVLSLNSGMVIHSCGLKTGGRGVLFIGASGSGKSTMAKLWKHEKDTLLLNDDRMIVRKSGSEFYVYGTPWHGQARICSQGKAPLEKIFFITHADSNYVQKLDPVDTASRLIASSFLPFWDKHAMELIIRLASEFARRIPSYELGFLPDKSVLDFIKKIA